MTVSIRYEEVEPLDKCWEELIEKVISFCLDYEKCPYEVDVSVLLTNDSLIQEINQEFRGIDNSTDVISFPFISFDTPSDFTFLEKNSENNFHPDTGELLLGDIAISFQRAKRQAKDYGHSLEREISFLVAHSMFHLLGYNHELEEDRIEMKKKQDEVLKLLNILR